MAIGLVTPSIVLAAVEVVVGKIGFAAAVTDVCSREFAEGENIFLLSVIGLIPYAFLSFFAFALAGRLGPRRLACVSLGGLAGILAYTVPAHASIWRPLYSGGHVSSTSAIAFLFVPFYAIPVLVIGMALGWMVSLLLRVRAR